ncbi:class I adenylate-forming enzyme family protein [Nocardioides marmoribigeumensis]|uniref:Long-chain acyl-CoA synthetase n=1 Tax=Nocardioides marmoribigeumensis TaxID=433649 RepID=A0ABU2BT82_9ACTN|nr:class I adenylate-forming enzyme family protein [Nocardioides marmoribigeumensis]MDR7361214.1 long-chain acyl-CoA synthetase [Nocardioides marmoribigeumensis]
MTDLLDLPQGSVVALQVPGSTAYVEVVLALLGRGVVPAPLDPRLTAAETAGILEDLEPVAHVTDPADVDDLAERVAGEPRRTPLARPMHMTSGTTGRPKGVWSGVLTEEQGRALVEEERDLWGFRSDDVNLVVSPLHHSAPLRFAMGTVLAGGRLVVPGPFDVARLTHAIESEHPTTAFVVPTHLARLFAHWDEVGTPDLSSFRLLAHAGAACPQPVKERLLETFPPGTTWEFYGSTEGQLTACPGEEWRERPGTVGRARPGRSITVAEDRTIWCVVPEHARFTYYREPAKTAEAWRETPDGPAFTVGDHGRIDDDGYLYLDGRREDLVISGGVNVYPAEVEDVLSAVPGVLQVAVFGREDPDWGQRVCAAYVGEADPADLAARARERLSPAKRPKEYHRLDDLPHTPTGKVQRLLLPDLVEPDPA